MRKACLTCNGEFITYANELKKGWGRFCSRKCAYVKRKKRVYQKSLWICKQCGKKKMLQPSRARERQFCSQKCKGEYTKNNNLWWKWNSKRNILRNTSICLICGKPNARRENMCCSRVCANLLITKNHREMKACLECKKLYVIRTCERKRKFCSKECEKTYLRKTGYHKKILAPKVKIAMQRKWDDVEYASKMLGKIVKKPNSMELSLLEVIHSINPNYRYVGDGQFWLGRKNPDYVNQDEKKIIELYGECWHKKQNEEKLRIQHFERFGFKTLVVWSKELRDEDKLKSRIEDFNSD